MKKKRTKGTSSKDDWSHVETIEFVDSVKSAIRKRNFDEWATEVSIFFYFTYMIYY